MKSFIIESKVNGIQAILLDDIDYQLLKEMGGKIWVCKKRGKLYAQKTVGGKIIELQRLLMKPLKGQYVDHINGDTLDNRRNNLRIVSNGANLRNSHSIRSNNSSGVNGVYLNKKAKKKKWIAEIKVKYTKIWLGSYKTFDKAVKARKEAELKYFNI